MSRRNKPPKRVPLADPMFNSVDIAKFINRLMRRGKKSVAERIFYTSFERIKEKTKEEPLEVFTKAIKNVTPLVEVKARRIGGSTYQVPIEVKPERGMALGSNWLISSAKARSGKSMVEKLTNEIMDAANSTGSSVKKREDTHKMAEANKAFAHYRY
ncbi:MAG: 30S ribosomal protein S7 [Candidatus Gastranaerophilales bacterium]|nr:30S ribosomal protein S7 [Candidatus Gastranaerophilales bacterium]